MADFSTDDWEGRRSPSHMQWSLWVDVSITRRKRYHLVADAEHQIVFRSMLLAECLQYLEDADIHTWRLMTPEKTFGISRQWCEVKEGT